MQFGILFFFLLSVFGAVAEDACPPTEIVKYAELYANSHLHSCQKASAGFSLAPPMGYPTDPQVKAMCASDACLALIKDVLDLKPADCLLSFAGVKLNLYKMAHNFENGCHHEEVKYHPTPKPAKETEYYHPTPKPTKYEDHPTPKPTKEEYHPTPKPTKYYSSPKSTEDDKHYHTPKPTKYYPTSKPTHYTPNLTHKTDHFKPEEPMFVKCDHADKACPKHCAIKEAAKDAEAKPPMNGTAFELFPIPNTTYKATASPKV